MSLESRQADASAELLELVERDRVERVQAIRREAAAEARQIEQEARRSASERVRSAADACRHRRHQVLSAARSELATRARQRKQALERDVVDGAFPKIEQELQRRWQDPEARSAWIRGVVECALATLPEGCWRIDHPKAFDTAELRDLVSLARRHAGAPPELHAEPELGAGLRIHTAGAMLDGSVEGLLSDRTATLSRLLGELSATDADAGGPG